MNRPLNATLHKVRRARRVLCCAGLFACAALAGRGHAAPFLLSATLEPHEITMGETADLTITMMGTDSGTPSVPAVSGLRFHVAAQNHRIEFIRGASVAITVTTIRITPNSTGTYQIPGMGANAGPLVLHVLAEEATPKSSRAGSLQAAAAEGIHLTANGAAFVRLALPKREVYVGESVPVEIEVGVKPGFVTSLNGLPTLSSDEFTLNNLSRQPERGERVIDRERFAMMSWHSEIAPVKAGSYTLSVQSPVTVRIRLRPEQDAKLDDLLGDPFMQNYYGKSVQKDIKIASPPATLTVLPLPAEGRPPDYDGAVGTFKVTSEVTPLRAAVGDPLTLRLHVRGSGNFDRVNTAMLEHAGGWKTYPPKSSFKASDSIGFSGEKTFEQPLIASRPGPQSVPALAFSYFDPEARRYVTATTAAIDVTITTARGEDVSSPPPLRADTSALRPDHAASGGTSKSLLPLYLQPAFLSLGATFGVCLAGGWWIVGRRAPGRTPATGNPRALARALTQIDAAQRTQDPVKFLADTQAVVRAALAQRWQVPADSIDGSLLSARLGDGGKELAELFRIADAARYAGRTPEGADIRGWAEMARRELQRLAAA